MRPFVLGSESSTIVQPRLPGGQTVKSVAGARGGGGPGASSVQLTQTAPEPTQTTPTTPTTSAAAPPPPPPPAASLTIWPAARSGWTVVLDSLPSVDRRAPAVAEAKQAIHLGLKKVGILDSAQFSSLHPGYFVVFYGIYDSQAAAQSAILDAHRRGYGGAYPRKITP